nr:DUF4012 domain-containing protein [Propionicimonas sp.]
MPEAEEPLAGDAATPGGNPKGPRPRRVAGRRRRWWLWTILGVVVVGLAVAGWLAFRVLTVKNELEAAQASLAAVQKGGDTSDAVTSIATHATVAAAAANDPVWRAFESTPMAGDNLRAVRLASESLETLTAGLAVPVLDAFHGTGDEPVLARIIPIMQSAQPRVAELSVSVAEVQKSTSLVSQVRSGVDQVSQVLGVANPALDMLPRMLGADGPKNYLMVAQNNAESVGLGGSAASQTLIRITDGKPEIKKQTDSNDFRMDKKLDVDIDKSATKLFGETMLYRINASVSRPDFPTAAQLIKAFWQRDIRDDEIDGVVSIDPIALSHVLKATGPIKVAGGEEATSENIVRLVLSDVYARASSPDESDGFFKQVALAVFEKVSTGQFDPKAMLTAVQTGIDGGNILFWSADEEIQERVAGMRIGGILPTDNTEQTTLGVFFRDHSLGAKIDYYMKPAVALSATCSADGTTVFNADVTLHLDISQAKADKLPDYVKSAPWGATRFDTEVFVYGPPGTTAGKVTLDATTKLLRKVPVEDLGRPVSSFKVTLKPGESRTVTVPFQGTASAYGPLALRTTPMVHATKVTLADGRCAAK